MSEVRCIGHERSLAECRFQDGEQSGCQHNDDAAVRCHVPHMDFQSQVSPRPTVQTSIQSPIAQPLHVEPLAPFLLWMLGAAQGDGDK